jgi:AcrR family transcriptional regulator
MSEASSPPPSDSPRAQRRQRTRAAILGAAARCFGELGFAGASMDALAAAAGVTKPTIYAHFGNKEALFDATLRDRFAGLKDGPLVPASDPVQARTALVQHAHAMVDGMLAPGTLGLMRAAVAEALVRPDWARSLFESAPVSPLVAWLAALDAQGVLSVRDPQTAATLLHGLVKGPLVHPAMLGAGPVPDAETRERVIHEAVRVFLAGHAAMHTQG